MPHFAVFHGVRRLFYYKEKYGIPTTIRSILEAVPNEANNVQGQGFRVLAAA